MTTWWADEVVGQLSPRLEECRTWLRYGTYDDFVVTLVVPMSGDGGNWATWIRISPLSGDLGGGLRILYDLAGEGFGVPLFLGRGLEEPAPGRKRHTVAILAGFKGDLPLTADTFEYQGIPIVLRRGAGSENRRKWPDDTVNWMAQHLCERYGGENLRRTDDGLWSFTLRA